MNLSKIGPSTLVRAPFSGAPSAAYYGSGQSGWNGVCTEIGAGDARPPAPIPLL